MDISLHYIEEGSGFPLILLHGNGEDGSYFAGQLPAFSQHYRTYVLDTRGHGSSPRGQGEFSLHRFAEDLKCFMDDQGIEKAHLLGFSDGGNIALLFALKYPERVEKLVLNGANLDPNGVKPWVQLPVVLGYCLASLLAPVSQRAKPKKELLGLMVTQPHIKPDRLAGLLMPTLVIAGSNDMIKDRHTRLIAASLPNAKLCILSGSHFIAAENAEAFNRAVLNFLAE